MLQKLTNKKVNDVDELKKLYLSLIQALRSIFNIVKDRYNNGAIKSDYPFWLNFGPVPFSVETIKNIPNITSFKWSVWNYLRNEFLPSIRDILYQYRPYAFNPLNFLPPFEKHAQISDGQHIFTFDGQHLTFPGNCQYILAQDIVNNNFTIIANLVDGKLQSITLLDKVDHIELNANGIVNLNNKQTELPLHKGDIYAWREYYSVSLLSTYGVRIVCSIDLRICGFVVNGYYHSKLRGVLGNGNSEPNDDFKLPSGKLSSNFADFGNAYKLTPSCTDVPFEDHHHHSNSELCNQYFGGESSLALGYTFIKPQKYREACEHAVGGASSDTEKIDAACNIALLYASTCRFQYIPVDAPAACGQCVVSNDKKYTIGESYKATAPEKKADIVIVVDTTLGPFLQEFVQPAIAQLRQELKIRDITDVHISVIGYNENRKYLSHYTLNGKLDINGKTLFSETSEHLYHQIKSSNPTVNSLLNDFYNNLRNLKDDLHMSPDGKAFREAMEYPFRSTAAKAIIAIRSDSLQKSLNPVSILIYIYITNDQ